MTLYNVIDKNGHYIAGPMVLSKAIKMTDYDDGEYIEEIRL